MDYFRSPGRGYSYLRFMSATAQDSPKIWKQAQRETINALISLAEEHLVGGKAEYPYDSHTYSLTWAYSLFSLLAILISEEFTAVLDAIPLGNIDEDQVCVLQTISRLWETINDHYGLAPVRVFDYREKRMFCEPTSPSELSWADYHAKRRILISIDPLTAPEDAASMLKDIVKKWQEEGFLEQKASYLEMSYTDEQADEMVTRDSLYEDYPRSPKTGKRPRGPSMFSNWLRWLRVYRAKKAGANSTEICEYRWWPYDKKNSSQVAKDKSNARKLIELALNNEPLCSIKPIS